MPERMILALIPILWLIFATVAAILLYRKGEAIWVREDESQSDSGRKKRQIIATGAVAIAALAFLGLKLATPSGLLEPKKEPQLSDALQLVQQIDDSHIEMVGCVKHKNTARCQEILDNLTELTTRLENKLNEAMKSK